MPVREECGEGGGNVKWKYLGMGGVVFGGGT